MASNIKDAPVALNGSAVTQLLALVPKPKAIRPLSDAAREAMINLHRDWHFGVDRRTARGLIKRGFVEIRTVTLADEFTMDLPYLTPAGVPVAAELYEAEMAAAGARDHRSGLRIVDGGVQ